MADKKIRALVKEPGREARIEEIEDNWKAYGALVGGLMETVHFSGMKDVLAVINEEGKLQNLEPNIWLPERDDLIVGTAVFVGQSGENFKSLNDAQIAKVKEYVAANDASGFTGDISDYNKVIFHSFDDGEAFLDFLLGDGDRGDDSGM